MLQSVSVGRGLAHDVHVGEQADGRSLRDRSDVNLPIAEELWEPAFTGAAQSFEVCREVAVWDGEPAGLCGTVDPSRNFVAQHCVFVTLLGPEHLLDGIVEGIQTGIDGRTPLELANAVVLQERRCGPDTDKRWWTCVAPAASGERIWFGVAGDRVVDRGASGGRQLFVSLRREVVPDVSGDRIRSERAAGIRVEQRHRD